MIVGGQEPVHVQRTGGGAAAVQGCSQNSGSLGHHEDSSSRRACGGLAEDVCQVEVRKQRAGAHVLDEACQAGPTQTKLKRWRKDLLDMRNVRWIVIVQVAGGSYRS